MIYFDNAATSWPKPSSVFREMRLCMQKAGGNPGRSAHPLALRASEVLYDCRCELAGLFGLSKPENVIFSSNTTSALNLAIGGLLRPGDEVITSDLEHNSVIRPLAHLRLQGVQTRFFHALLSDDSLLWEIEKQITPRTGAVITTHASNICPRVLPIGKIGALCRAKGIPFIVDAAQSAGHTDIQMKRDHITVLCVPGHKGLYGPQGSGAALFADDFDFDRLSPILFGGNGIQSALPGMGNEAPESYEAGTPATPAVAGLCAGVRFVRSLGTDVISAKETLLFRQMRKGLLTMPGLRLFLPDREEGNLLLFTVAGKNASAIARDLAAEGICVRAGMHCAPVAHEALQTGGDAVRVSFSFFNTPRECDLFLEKLEEIIRRPG